MLKCCSSPKGSSSCSQTSYTGFSLCLEHLPALTPHRSHLLTLWGLSFNVTCPGRLLGSFPGPSLVLLDLIMAPLWILTTSECV